MIQLKIGSGVARKILRSEFANEGATAWMMHAALVMPAKRTQSGFGEVLTVVAHPEPWDALAQWCERWGRTDVNAPKADQALARTHLRLAAKINKALRHLAQHPGYREVAVTGTDTTSLPGRRIGEGRWWPTVRMAHEHAGEGELEVCELVPHEVKRRGQTFTMWSPKREAPVR